MAFQGKINPFINGFSHIPVPGTQMYHFTQAHKACNPKGHVTWKGFYMEGRPLAHNVLAH